MKFITTTPVGTEGFNISYSDEKKCADTLKKLLPDTWTVKFSWAQIMMCDVQYCVDKKKKTVEVVYNKDLRIWWSEVLEGIKKAIPAKR